MGMAAPLHVPAPSRIRNDAGGETTFFSDVQTGQQGKSIEDQSTVRALIPVRRAGLTFTCLFRVARTMLPIAPYNTWPLHVKIFTEEAKKMWDEVQRPGLDAPLPRGFTYSVEYEGVDGKAQVTAAKSAGSRTGPIDVKDSMFLLDCLVIHTRTHRT